MFDGEKLDRIMKNWQPKKFTNLQMVERLKDYGVTLSENSIKAYRNCRADPSTKTLFAMAEILDVSVLDLMENSDALKEKVFKEEYKKSKARGVFYKLNKLTETELSMIDAQLDVLLKSKRGVDGE